MNISEVTDYKNNIDTKERITSVLSGTLLLAETLTRRRKSIIKTATAGYMIFRGVTGYCPLNGFKKYLPTS